MRFAGKGGKTLLYKDSGRLVVQESMMQTSFRRLIRVIGFCLLGALTFPGGANASSTASAASEGELCGSPDVCFQAAVSPKERFGNAVTNEQLLSIKLERLQQLIERFPSSIWAKRAGVLSGILLIERNPADAIQFLRGAQRDLPVLDDYIRLWLGEAFLNLGDAKQAAVMFESIASEVPDSNILTKAAYRSVEAWYQASGCDQVTKWFDKAVALSDKEPDTPKAYLRSGACQLRENNVADGRKALKQLWVRFPYTPEAKEAESLLTSNLDGQQWIVQPTDRYSRAQAYLAQAYHAEAIEELKSFLGADPPSPLRAQAKLKLGVAQVRLKQYDEARETFHAIVKMGVKESNEALVWLARVHLRQGQGDRLLEIARTLSSSSLSAEQKGQIGIFAGVWLEDEKRFDEAIARYMQIAKQGEPASQRYEARWRAGWVYYRTGRFSEAGETLRILAEQHDGDFEPQALYWMGRSAEHYDRSQVQDFYHRVCEGYRYTYYCQLALERMTANGKETRAEPVSDTDHGAVNGERKQWVENRADIEQQASYRRALELKMLGVDSDAAHEVAVLTDRFDRDPDQLVALATMLNEVGAYHHALRLARAKFREQLERTGGTVAPVLWKVAYPNDLLPIIRLQEAKNVDPFLIEAIIREESQYDMKALSRVGAVGLMQVMPSTANNVARRVGIPPVKREDLFDAETNIRIGVHYVEELLERFSGNLVHTIAAYNAGPMAVSNWVAQFRGEGQDEFVELIPYQETRYYVKRVLRSYREYVRLEAATFK